MKKKTAVVVLVFVIIAALILGFLLLSKGDGPVMGMVLAGSAIENTDAYNDAVQAHGNGIYLVVSNAFNKFREEYKIDVPQGKDLYAVIYFVECPQGSEYTGKWVKDGAVLQEETKTLPTGPQGVISYMLDKGSAAKGSYTFELYDGNAKIFEKSFSVE